MSQHTPGYGLDAFHIFTYYWISSQIRADDAVDIFVTRNFCRRKVLTETGVKSTSSLSYNWNPLFHSTSVYKREVIVVFHLSLQNG